MGTGNFGALNVSNYSVGLGGMAVGAGMMAASVMPKALQAIQLDSNLLFVGGIAMGAGGAAMALSGFLRIR